MITKLICNKSFDKTEVKLLIEWFLRNYGSSRTMNILNKIKYVGFKYATKMSISLSLEDLKVPSMKKILLINIEKTLKIYKIKKKLGLINRKIYLEKSHFLWNNINSILNDTITKNFKQTNTLNPVYLMISSGARGNLSQIKQIIGLRGLMSNSKGEIVNSPIKTNLKDGLNSIEYFISCYGARKGLIDTALKTANSGYLTRRLIFVGQNIIIKQRDCKSKNGILIKCKKKNKRNLFNTKKKLIGRILAENIILKKEKLFSKGQDICNYIANKLIQLEKNIYVRSNLKCNLNIGICQLCYGWDLSTNKITKIGDPIGIVAAQSIGEPGTQLTMRTFHTGGIFTSNSGKLIHAPYKGKIQNFCLRNLKLIKTRYDENSFFINKKEGLNILLKQNEKNSIKINIPKYSILFIKPKEKVYEKQIIAEIPRWKNSIKKESFYQTKTNFEGKTHINITLRKNEVIWILKGNLVKQKAFHKCIFYQTKKFKEYNEKICYRKSVIKKIVLINLYKKKSNYSKYLEINKKKKKSLLFFTQKEKKYLKYKKKVTKFIKEKQKIKSKLEKYHQGQILQEKNKIIQLNKGTRYKVKKNDKITIKNNTLINKNVTIVLNILKTNKTKDIVEGLPKIEQLLEIKKNNVKKNDFYDKLQTYFKYFSKKFKNEKANKKTIEKIQKKLIKETQKVYEEQKVNISEKHIELIIKQMTSKALIQQSTNSNFLKGDIIDLKKIEKINLTRNNKITYEPLILGISKISLLNDSFLSSASFQETTRILAKSAIMGKLDWLKGLKENIILGKLIPIGTTVNTFFNFTTKI